MKRLFIALLAICWLTPAPADDHLLSEEAFTERYLALLAESAAGIEVEVTEPLSMKMTYPDGREFEANLHNAYELYSNDPAGVDDVLGQYVAFAVEALEPRPDTLSVADIVPVVKDDEWVTEMIRYTLERSEGESNEIYRESLTPGLTIVYAEDTPTSIRYIQEDALAEAGVDLAGIRGLAIENLARKLPNLEVAGGPGLYMLIADGNYEGSLLLIDELWAAGNFDVAGELVVSLPARDVLLVSGTENTEQLDQLRGFRDQAFAESPYRITTTLYVRRDGGWVPMK